MVKKPSSAGNSHRLSKSFTCARGDTASLFSDFEDDDDDDDEDDDEEEEGEKKEDEVGITGFAG